MGVTYKLKDEVVEFILRQKRDNPQISCRKLVIAIQSAFGLNVSKSSINAVIKEAHLSSPVGRTPAELSRTKKFTIPKEKKVQLFGDEFSVPNKDEQVKQSEAQSSPIAPVQSQPTEPAQGQISKPVGSPTPSVPQEHKHEEFADVQENLPQEFESSESSQTEEKVTLQSDVVEARIDTREETFEIKEMRPFFLRMALWEFFSKPVLEEFFKRHTSLGEYEIRIVDVLACLTPDVLSDPSQALDPQNIWLWKLSGWAQLPEKDDVEAVIKFLTTTKIPKFDYLLELGYFCSMVGSVKFILSNNQHILLDGRYQSVDSREIKSFPFCPIERAVEETVRFIDGKNTLALRCPTQKRLKEILARLYSCFALNHENQVKKIILMGTQGDQLTEFDHIPDRPRNFIVSAAIPEGDFGSLFGIPPGFIPEQKLGLPGAQYMFSDKMVDLFEADNGHEMKLSVRMVVFNRQDLGFLEVFLTNIPQSAFSAREIEAMAAGSRQKRSEGEVFDRKPASPESFFAGDDAECAIGQAIDNLNRIIEENMNIIFSQTDKEDNFYTSICKESGYIILGQRNLKVQIKSTAGLPGQTDNEFADVLKVYRKTTYDGKKISQIL